MSRAKATGGKAAAAKSASANPKRTSASKLPRYRTKVVEGERMVEDPYEPGVKVKARVNLAEHPLEMMRVRGRIDNAQYEAGIRFRAIYERASIGRLSGIDHARIRVDGGVRSDPFTDAVAIGLNDLRRLSRELGMVGYRIVQAVAGQGEMLGDLAARWPGSEAERTKRDYLTLRFREALDTLALEVWGARGPSQ